MARGRHPYVRHDNQPPSSTKPVGHSIALPWRDSPRCIESGRLVLIIALQFFGLTPHRKLRFQRLVPILHSRALNSGLREMALEGNKIVISLVRLKLFDALSLIGQASEEQLNET